MAESLYRVTFPDPETKKLVTVRVREISDSGLGVMFIKLSGFVFETEGTVINPNNEALATRYEGIKAIHVNRMTMGPVEEFGEADELQLAEVPNIVQFKPPE